MILVSLLVLRSQKKNTFKNLYSIFNTLEIMLMGGGWNRFEVCAVLCGTCVLTNVWLWTSIWVGCFPFLFILFCIEIKWKLAKQEKNREKAIFRPVNTILSTHLLVKIYNKYSNHYAMPLLLLNNFNWNSNGFLIKIKLCFCFYGAWWILGDPPKLHSLMALGLYSCHESP